MRSRSGRPGLPLSSAIPHSFTLMGARQQALCPGRVLVAEQVNHHMTTFGSPTTLTTRVANARLAAFVACRTVPVLGIALIPAFHVAIARRLHVVAVALVRVRVDARWPAQQPVALAQVVPIGVAALAFTQLRRAGAPGEG
jgi:hypothetical protein